MIETNPDTRRFKTIPHESHILQKYLNHRSRVQEKLDGDYRLMCKVLKLQALSKEMSNKLLRQRKHLGLLSNKKKSTKIGESVEPSESTSKTQTNHISSIQRNLDEVVINSFVNQQDIEVQLTKALENHLMKKKRTIPQDEEPDWRNSCPVDMVPQSLGLALKHEANNESRFSVQNPVLLDKALTKRKLVPNSDVVKKNGKEIDQGTLEKQVAGEERRELGNWAKEKIRSIRDGHQLDLDLQNGGGNDQEKERMWVTDAFHNLKTNKSEKNDLFGENNLMSEKYSISHLNSKKLVPQKSSKKKKKSTKLYTKSNNTLNQFQTSKPKKTSHKNKRKKSNYQGGLNLSRNITHAKREKEFWNRLGSGKINSRMTRSFFLSKQGKSAVPSKKDKKAKNKNLLNKSKSALKRDMFKKGSSSFGNLFSEFRANYKNYRRKPDAGVGHLVSPCVSSKVIGLSKPEVFGSKARSKVIQNKKRKLKYEVENLKYKKNEKRLPAISFRTMQEGRANNRYKRPRENQLEEGLNAKMLKILSKMENLKETVMAEKHKLISSGKKNVKIGVVSGDFSKGIPKSSKKNDFGKYNRSSKKMNTVNQGGDLPKNLTFSDPQKLRELGELSNKKKLFSKKKASDAKEEKTQELKLIPMTDLNQVNKTPTNFSPLDTFKNIDHPMIKKYSKKKGTRYT